jgi:tetratricopeptide (TPR) repeat protein
LNGELKWAARNEQAVIERRLGKPQDAIALYDEVLKSDARPAERREALCGKADIFFELGGNENHRRAIELYDQLAAENDAPPHWRNQALFKKGLCLENAARLLEEDSKWDSAVAIYQKLAAVGGSRSEEAKTRLNRLRLEHFLWSD